MDTISQRAVTAEGRELPYNLERKQVKNLNLRVRKDGSVWVSADPGVPCGEIDAFVVSKAPYIQKALDHFHEMAQYRPQPKQYVSGEAFNILGRGLRLQVTQTAKDSISADGVYIHLGVRDLPRLSKEAARRQQISGPAVQNGIWRRDGCAVSVVSKIRRTTAFPENPGHGNALGLLPGEEGNHHTEQASPRSPKTLHRIRCHARAMPSGSPQPLQAVLCLSHDADAGLEGTEAVSGQDRSLLALITPIGR